MIKQTGPLFYVTEKDGQIVHLPREVPDGEILYASGHTITSPTLAALSAEVESRGMKMPLEPWRGRIQRVWRAAPPGLVTDPVLQQLAGAIGALDDVEQIRAVILTAKAANAANQKAVVLAEALLAELP